MLNSRDIISKCDDVEEDDQNISCSIKFKTLPFTIQYQRVFATLFLFILLYILNFIIYKELFIVKFQLFVRSNKDKWRQMIYSYMQILNRFTCYNF